MYQMEDRVNVCVFSGTVFCQSHKRIQKKQKNTSTHYFPRKVAVRNKAFRDAVTAHTHLPQEVAVRNKAFRDAVTACVATIERTETQKPKKTHQKQTHAHKNTETNTLTT
jgi:hypothetical protein